MAARQQAGTVQSYRSLWIINAVAVAGSVESVTQVANRPDVARIVLDEKRPLIESPEPAKQLETMWSVAALAATSDEPWGIDRVRAAYAWQGLGIDGSGITVGIMDSGADWQHPDLLPNYRGNLGAARLTMLETGMGGRVAAGRNFYNNGDGLPAYDYL